MFRRKKTSMMSQGNQCSVTEPDHSTIPAEGHTRGPRTVTGLPLTTIAADQYRTDLAWADVVLNTVHSSVPMQLPADREQLDACRLVSSEWSYDSAVTVTRHLDRSNMDSVTDGDMVGGTDGMASPLVSMADMSITVGTGLSTVASVELFMTDLANNVYVCLFTVNGFRIGVVDVVLSGLSQIIDTPSQRRALRSILNHQKMLAPFFDMPWTRRTPAEPTACGHMVENLLRFVADPDRWLLGHYTSARFDRHRTLAGDVLHRVFMGVTAETSDTFNRMVNFLDDEERMAALAAGWGTVDLPQVTWLAEAIIPVAQTPDVFLLNVSWDFLRTAYEWGWSSSRVTRLLSQWFDATDGDSDYFVAWLDIDRLSSHGFTGHQIGLLAEANMRGDEAVQLDDAGQLDWDSVQLLAALTTEVH